MTAATQAKVAAVVAGLSEGASLIAGISPSDQDNLFQALLAIFPVSWRPEITAIGHLIFMLALYWAVHSAAKSAPTQQPQTNK